MSLKSRLFYVIYIDDLYLKTLINGLRLFADSTQKHDAHITVRGPYEHDRPKDEFLLNWIKKVENKFITVNGVDSFFDIHQSTVFFSCNYSEDLKAIWKKKSYSGFTPHITLYDKNDSLFARNLLDLLSEHSFNFSFKINSVEPLISNKNTLFDGKDRLIERLDYILLSELLGHKITNELIIKSSKDKKLYFIREIALVIEKLQLHYTPEIPSI